MLSILTLVIRISSAQVSESSQVAEYFLAIVSTLAAVSAAAWFTWRRWRLQHFTEEWAELMRFLHANPELMDQAKTSRYRETFQGDDLIRYELTARLCIAFIDDMYFQRYKHHLKKWYRGSLHLLVGTHLAWFRDNRLSYDPAFVSFVEEELNREVRAD